MICYVWVFYESVCLLLVSEGIIVICWDELNVVE